MKNYHMVYFSPTNTTQKIVKEIAGSLPEPFKEFDITAQGHDLSFGSDDFVIVGIPVYSGRVPAIARERLSSMSGNKTPVALAATFGNRHYDDALLELKHLLESSGFLVVGAAAFVTEHSVVPRFGKGRPDESDKRVIQQFTASLKNKINIWDADAHMEVKVKGNPEYRKYQSIPIKPHTTSACTKCGLCAGKCPAKAIPPDNPRKTDKQKCVTCVRCIRICPKGARKFYKLESFLAERSLKKLCSEYKQPEIFM